MTPLTQTRSQFEGTETHDSLGIVAQLVMAYGPEGQMTPTRRPLMCERLSLGRGQNPMGLGVLDDSRVSRRHAQLSLRGGAWWIKDLGSRNGTTINGEKLDTPRLLDDGDIIRVGDTFYVFRIGPLAANAQVATDPSHPLLGVSPEMDALRDDLAALGPQAISVLVLGETGAGKEVIARTLHTASGRDGAFVALNCAALPPELMESTLFGHEKGAFTGADSKRAGLIREAHRGTLFLDELGEMPLALQAKLLRVLETRAVRPVGGSTTHTVDVRVVSATHRDLAQAVRDGRFRLDLYGRLAHWVLRLPALRERREDVPTLAAHFARRALSPNLVEALMGHPWPLNVRGLKAMMARAWVQPGDKALKLDRHLRLALSEAAALIPLAEPGVRVPGSMGAPGPRAEGSAPVAAPTTARTPREPPSADALTAALRAHKGRIAAVARALDGSRQQVYRWIKLHGLELDDFRS